jgi:hypothetical protein
MYQSKKFSIKDLTFSNKIRLSILLIASVSTLATVYSLTNLSLYQI